MTDLPTPLRYQPSRTLADPAPVAGRVGSTADAPSTAPSLRRRPLLDGLRGVMVVLTVAYHLESGSWLHGGWLGVSGFFVLSGFLITALLLVEWAKEGRVVLVRFYARRARRLAPTLLAVVAATAVAVRLTGAAPDEGRMRGDGLATLGYVANWRFIQTDQSYFSSFTPSALRHTWSLGIEEQFYLVWPWLLMLAVGALGRRRLAAVFAAGAATSAWWAGYLVEGGTPLARVYDGTDTRAQELLVGALAAALALGMGPPSAEAGGAARRRRWATVVGVGGLAVFAVAAVVLRPSTPATYTRGLLLLVAVVIGGVVLACTVVDRGPLGVLLGGPVLRGLGARSYSLYLVHWPVFVILDEPRVYWSPLPLDGVRLITVLALTELVHRVVEEPFHRGRVPMRHPGRVLVGATIAVALVVLATTWPTGPGDAADDPMTAKPSVITVPPAEPAAPRVPRLVLLGDSQANALLQRRPTDAGIRIGGAQQGGCDLIGEVIAAGDRILESSDGCSGWTDRWGRALEGGADVVVVTLGLRQLFDPVVDGERVPIGSPEWEQLYRDGVDRAIGAIRAHSQAPILWLDVPCYRWYLTEGEEGDAARLRTVNLVLADQLSQHPGVTIAPYGGQVCEGADGTDSIDALRPDGVHVDDAGAEHVWTWIRMLVAGMVSTG